MANNIDKAHLRSNVYKKNLTIGIPIYIGEKTNNKSYKQMSIKYCRNLIIERL
jgi:hypothetical protein